MTQRILERLQLRIRRSPLTQRAVENRLGFSSGYLSRLLHGTVEIKCWHVLAILDAIGLEPSELFGELFPRRRHPALELLNGVARRSEEGSLGHQPVGLFASGIETAHAWRHPLLIRARQASALMDELTDPQRPLVDARPVWRFAEHLGQELQDPREIGTLVYSLFFGRSVASVTLLDGAACLVAVGAIDPARLLDRRSVEEVLIDVYLRTYFTKARWALPILFLAGPRAECHFLHVNGPPWLDLDTPEDLRVFLRGDWLSPALRHRAATISEPRLF